MDPKSIPIAVVLTAIPLEYNAVKLHLTLLEEIIHPIGNVYEKGVFEGKYHQWIIGIAEVGAGNNTCALETERAINYFKPDVILFVGIAGGIKDLGLGDIVAPEKVYGYERGKVSSSGFLTRPDIGKSSYAIFERAKAEAKKNDWKNRLPEDLRELPFKTITKPIAAGEKVVAEIRSEIYDLIRQSYNDAVAVEMEGSDFFSACHALNINATDQANGYGYWTDKNYYTFNPASNSNSTSNLNSLDYQQVTSKWNAVDPALYDYFSTFGNLVLGTAGAVAGAEENLIRAKTSNIVNVAKSYFNSSDGQILNATNKLADGLSVTSKYMFWTGAAISGYNGISFVQNGDYLKAAKSSADIGVSAYGVWGGPAGAIFSTAYWGIDNFYPGGLSGALTDYSNNTRAFIGTWINNSVIILLLLMFYEIV